MITGLYFNTYIIQGGFSWWGVVDLRTLKVLSSFFIIQGFTIVLTNVWNFYQFPQLLTFGL